MSFRRELKALIARKAMSQREFASRCGKSPAWASRILRGSLPLKSLDEVLMIGEVLALDAEEANRLCQGYQSESVGPYGVMLHAASPRGTQLVLIDATREIATWKGQGGETITGEFAVVARAVVGPTDEEADGPVASAPPATGQAGAAASPATGKADAAAPPATGSSYGR